MKQAGDLETELGVPDTMGQFRDQKQGTPRQRLIQAEIASWVVYLSVLVGWLYIAGAHRRWDRAWPWWISVIALCLLARALAIACPNWWRKENLKKIV
jgi:hypothetical protein